MKRKTPLFAIALVITCTFLTSFGQYFIKIGTKSISGNALSLLSFPLIGGFFLYGIGAIILIIALKYGELSVLYPFIALSFIWVFFLSFFLLRENILFANWLGLVLIILGVSFIGGGGK
ncbi:MAG: EamA family transporter [Nanoarchaeota archaeon]|nr:EamA family transporter [Nanoarchaeota archaeon]MBU1270134.1 EamA family transporter [Nanoarchaeota archaeon]MBU1604460.1 EamA family transporter [Nanoarchaeota archaeon]MBU2443469.1 EamA family transporter [Nanoarchaeota archaeon]